LLPEKLTGTMAASLSMLGLDATDFSRFDPALPLDVDELTVVGTDRFRPELLRAVRSAMTAPVQERPYRRVFISRARSRGRHIVNEDDLWPVLRDAGFERVFME